MSASSDSEDYSSRVLSKNKKNDENFMSCKNDFIKDFQNRSHIPNVVQTSFSKANGSFENDAPKRKREQLEESENYLNSVQTKKKKKKVHHSDEVDAVENQDDDFVTVRADHKSKSKKKNHTFPDADELLESESSNKKTLSLPGELNVLEVESVGIEPEQAVPHKKAKKSKKRSKIETESSVNQSLHTPSSGKRRDSIITSTQVDKRSLPPQDLNESKQSLLDFEQKNLSIQNIESDDSDDESEINELIQNVKLNLQSPKKSSKKVRSENLTKTVDPAHILKTFEKNNNLSLKKVNFENDSLHNRNRPCFMVKVPVDLDPHQLIGSSISVDKKQTIEIGTKVYATSLRDRKESLVFLEKNNRLLRLEVLRTVIVKPTSKANVLSNKEMEILDNLISEQVTSVGSKEQAKLEKAPTKVVKNYTNQLDRFLKDGARVLEEAKRVRILCELEKQTNLVLQKQVKFLKEQNTSTTEYKKMRIELEKETRELLHKRVNIMNSKKEGSDGELSDYF